jgi:Limiting CO2-inducible proteins B/C beta carbonyic anhydrases
MEQPVTSSASSALKIMRKELSLGTLCHAYDHDDEGDEIALSKDAVQRVLTTVKTKFPTALSSHVLAFQLRDVLAHRGFTAASTHVGVCFCGDDVNRSLEDELRSVFDNNNSVALHGLAGFMFGGTTALTDMLQHIPPPLYPGESSTGDAFAGGHGLLIYGPHVGIDWDGIVGKVNRRGHVGSSACCAVAAAAATAAAQVLDGTRQALDDTASSNHDILYVQRIWIQHQVQQHAVRLRDAGSDAAVELPHVLLECQTGMINDIVAQSCGSLKVGCTLAVVGGIQINTPEGTSEYFVPLRFSLYNHNGEVVEEDLLSELHNSMANTATW